jgi:hypothetical protein
MHDGSTIRLKAVGREHDPRSKGRAIALLEESQRNNEFVTGLLYYEEPRPTLSEIEHIVDTPLSRLSDAESRPGKDALDKIMKAFM